MRTNTINSENSAATEAPEQRPKRAATEKAKPQKKPAPAKMAGKRKAEPANKKTEAIALMKRAKGATLAEIVTVTGWQPHTVRGVASILGRKGGDKIES